MLYPKSSSQITQQRVQKFDIGSSIMSWGCDCIFFFNYNRINMGLHNQAVEEHMNSLFGRERVDNLREQHKKVAMQK